MKLNCKNVLNGGIVREELRPPHWSGQRGKAARRQGGTCKSQTAETQGGVCRLGVISRTSWLVVLAQAQTEGRMLSVFCSRSFRRACGCFMALATGCWEAYRRWVKHAQQTGEMEAFSGFGAPNILK